MSLPQPERLLLLFAHLLLCVFALQRVLATDWSVLRGTLRAEQLAATHRMVLGLLAGLWLTGLAITAIDLGFDATQLAGRPKLATKLVAASVLSLNGVLLRCYSFPRLAAGRALAWREAAIVMCSGAVSTTSWLVCAFIGIARPLAQWPLVACLALYGLALAAALVAALVLSAVAGVLPRMTAAVPLPSGASQDSPPRSRPQ